MSWAGADMVAMQVQKELFAATFSRGLIMEAGEQGERGNLQTYRGGEEGLPERGIPGVSGCCRPKSPEPRKQSSRGLALSPCFDL